MVHHYDVPKPGEAGKHKAMSDQLTAHYFKSPALVVLIEQSTRRDGMGMPIWEAAPLTMDMLNQAYELGKAGGEV